MSTRRLVPLLLAASLLLSTTPLHAREEEASPPAEERVGALRWLGVESVEAEDLERHILTQRPGWRFWRERPELVRAALEHDLERIQGYYRNHGFYETVAHYEITTRGDSGRVEITFIVEEGEPVRVATVRIELAPGAMIERPDLEVLEAALPLQPGEIFSVASYRAARSLALRHFTDRAHPRVRLGGGADVDVETHLAQVAWIVEPGPPVRFGAVRIEGLESIQEHVVLRELRLHEGDPYSMLSIERSRRRLLDLKLFSVVIVTTERTGEEAGGAPQIWPVQIEIKERKPRTISVGAGWGTGEGFRASASWTHRNFLGGGRRLRLSGAGSSLEQRARARLLQPYVFDTQATGEVSAQWTRRQRDSYDANEVSLRIGPRRSFGPHWVGEVAYRLGWTGVSNISDENNEVLREQRDQGILSGVDIGFRRSELDTRNNPSRGTFLDLRMAPNLSGLGSDFDFVRFEADMRGYAPLGPTVFALRLRSRAVYPFHETSPAEVPLSQRLYLGGPHTGRGFSFEKLGPLDDEGDPVGGTSSLLASAEWRVPLFWRLTAVGFIDVGQVNLEPFALNGDDWGVGVGPGITIATPIGPLAFYAGYPLEPVEQSQKWRFYFAVGHAF